VVAVIVILVYVMPGMVEMFVQGDAELPAITQFMLDLSDFFEQYWVMLFLCVA
jgi:type IV pilus assembly protein PilC